MNILPSNKIVVTWRGDNTFATNHDAAHSVRSDFIMLYLTSKWKTHVACNEGRFDDVELNQ